MSAPDAEMAKALAYDNEKETMPDIRIDPADRKAYTLEDLMNYYKNDLRKISNRSILAIMSTLRADQRQCLLRL